MLRLLRTVSWRDYRAAPRRLVLVIGGIAAGVALIGALGTINASVLWNFRNMLEQAAGQAALQVELGTGEIGFDESTIEIVAANPSVTHALGLVRGTLRTPGKFGHSLQLFGIDFASDGLESYSVDYDRPDDELEVLNDPHAVFLTDEYASRHAIRVGSSVRFATPTGLKDLNVRGLLRAKGIATIYGGNLAVMDLPAAQRLLGKDRLVDQIDVILRDGTSVEEVQKELAEVLPEPLSVNIPATRGKRFERAIRAFQELLNGLALLCLLAGIFIVYNTMATATTERSRSLGILITLGAERRWILALVMAEAAIVGLVASIIGIVLAIGLAHLLTGLVVRSMGTIYAIEFPVDSLTISLREVLRCLVIGTTSCVAAAAIPARKASEFDPIELMRPDYRERMAVGSSSRRLLAVAALLLLATAVAVAAERTLWDAWWGNVAATLWYVTALVFSIPLMTWLVAVLQRIFPRSFGLSGRIAAAGLNRAPGRTAVTTAVIGLSLMVAVVLSSVSNSFRESFKNWFILSGDLIVSAVATEGGRGGWLASPLSKDVGELIRRIPGVARVETYRALQGQLFGKEPNQERIAVVAVSPGFIDTAQFRESIVEGDPDDARKAIQEDQGVLISDNLAERFGLGAGKEIVLPTPSGDRSFTINAVLTADYSGDRGSVIMNRRRFENLWHDDRVSHYNVFLDPGADLDQTVKEVGNELNGRYEVKVNTVSKALEYHQDKIRAAFKFTRAISLLVIVVTLAGIVDLLTTQIIERRREIGLLRVIGASEGTVARSIWIEALVIGLAGALLGTATSIGTSLLWVHVNFRILIGYIMEHHFAVDTAIGCALLATAVAALAGWWAARRALREPVLDAIRYE